VSTQRRILAVAAAAITVFVTAGCSSSGPTRPGEIDAGWDSLTLRADATAGALSVLRDGTVRYAAPSGAEDRQGVVSPKRLDALREAVERADLSPFDVAHSIAGTESDTLIGSGRIELVRSGVTLGLVWESIRDLNAAESALVGELLSVWKEARAEGAEMVEAIPTTRMLSGYGARVPGATAILVRNGDALLNLIRVQLGGRIVALPEIDFNTEMVVAVFAGPDCRPGSVVQVDVAASRTMGGYLQVPVTVYEPAEQCSGLTGTSPFDLVRLRRMDIEVFFLWDRITLGCR
jgi:hypothetical protein